MKKLTQTLIITLIALTVMACSNSKPLPKKEIHSPLPTSLVQRIGTDKINSPLPTNSTKPTGTTIKQINSTKTKALPQETAILRLDSTFLPQTPTSTTTPTATPTITPTATTTPTATVPPTLTPTVTSTVIQITLNKDKLSPPVTELIYMTTEEKISPPPNTVNTIWRTNLPNIKNPQPITSITDQDGNRPYHLTLSPDNKYLAFGRMYDVNEMIINILNVNESHLQLINDYGVVPHRNSNSFFWSADSKFIIYTKVLDWFSSSVEMYQYSLETDQIQVLLKSDKFINLVGWKDDLIYYILEGQYTLNTYNIKTKETKELSSVGRNYIIKMSPNGELAIFNGTVVNLQTGTKIIGASSYDPLWWPDSGGLIATNLQTKNRITQIPPINTLLTNSLTLQIEPLSKLYELINWSPDGRYLIYQHTETKIYYLLNIITGTVQQFEKTRGLEIGGWLTE